MALQSGDYVTKISRDDFAFVMGDVYLVESVTDEWGGYGKPSDPNKLTAVLRLEPQMPQAEAQTEGE